MFVERPPSRTTFLLPCITKKRSSPRKRKVQVRAQAALSSGRWGRAQNDHTDSPDPEVSEVPSKQRKVRPPRRHKGDAPWSSRVLAQRALPMLEI